MANVGPRPLLPRGMKPYALHAGTRIQELRPPVVICLVIAIVFVVLRIYTRARITRKLWWDDYTSVVALLFSIGYSVLAIEWALNGAGLPYQLSRINELGKMTFGLYLAWLPYNFFVKSSILLLYIRVFQPSKAMLHATWAVITYCLVIAVGGFFLILFLCKPQEKLYNGFIEGTCIMNPAVLGVLSSGLNIILDLLIFVLPVRPVWKLHLPRRQKFTLIGVFATGSFVCIVSIVRLAIFTKVVQDRESLRYAVSTTVWTAVEGDIGIVCGCLPSLKAFLTHFFPTLLGAGGGRSYPSDRRRSTTFMRGPNMKDATASELGALPNPTSQYSELTKEPEAVLLQVR